MFWNFMQYIKILITPYASSPPLLAMCVSTQVELNFIIEKNTDQNVNSIWINRDGETRDKIAVLCHYVLYVFALYEYNPTQTNTAMKIFWLQNFYTVGVMLKWLELTHGCKKVDLNFYCIKIYHSVK
jgi:hypothetical protein